MRTFLAALGAAILSLGTPAAQAGAGSTGDGNCRYYTASTGLDEQKSFSGYVVPTIVLRSPDNEPVSATVRCELYLNDGLLFAETFSGTAVVTGVAPVSYVAGPYDLIESCVVVDFTSDDTPTSTLCTSWLGTGNQVPDTVRYCSFEISRPRTSPMPLPLDRQCADAMAAIGEPLLCAVLADRWVRPCGP